MWSGPKTPQYRQKMKGFGLQFGFIALIASLWSSGLGCHSGNQDLKCFVDYGQSMTCCWSQKVSHNDPGCKVNVDDPEDPDSFPLICSPKQELRSSKRQNRICNVEVPYFAAMQNFNITLSCPRPGSLKEVAWIPEFRPFQHIKLKPPYNLTIVNNSRTGTDFVWLADHDLAFVAKLKFEMRYKIEDEQWKNAKRFQIVQSEQRTKIDAANLKAERVYEAQIRVRIVEDNLEEYISTWSDWSDTVKWKSKTPIPSVNVIRPILFSSLIFAGILIAVAVKYVTAKRYKVKKLHWLSIPDPGKFFYELNSTYGGNFQKWMGTTLPASFSSTEDLQMEISSVEISGIKDSESFIKQDYVSDSSGFKSIGNSSLSSFANQGYFWFSYPSAYEVDSCKVYFSYDRSGLRSGSERSGSYRCLSSSSDSLYDSSIQYSPCSVFERGLDHDRSLAQGAATGEKMDDPPGEPGHPSHGEPFQRARELGNIGQLQRNDCPAEGSHECLNPTAQIPLFESLQYAFVSLEDLTFKSKVEGVSRCGSNGHIFEECQTEPFPATESPLSTMYPQDGLRQECTSIFKTTSLNLEQSSDAYLSLKEVQSKYSNQSI
ncbi:interleukin-2 receptor subunit beta-like [Mustelus asterias]